MLHTISVSLVLPARNEAEAIDALLPTIPSEYDEIIVVSNCSTDDTETRVLKHAETDPRVKLIIENTSKTSGGYGSAVTAGILASTSNYIVIADCDNTYPIEDAVKSYVVHRNSTDNLALPIIEHMELTNTLFGNCSRYPDRDIPPFLRLGVNTLTREARLLFGIPTHDLLSGMMVIKRDLVPLLRLKEIGWNLNLELKLSTWLATGKDHWREYPIKQRNRIGTTKQHYISTGFSHLFYLLKYRLEHRG